MCAQFIWMKLGTLKGCHLLNKPAGCCWGRLASTLYSVAYTPHLSGDTTTSSSRSMTGVFTRWTIFLMKRIRDVFQMVLNNQQLLFVLITLVLEEKLLLHQLLYFVNGHGFKTESLYWAQTMGPTGVQFMMIGKNLYLRKENKKHSISSL